MNRILNVVVVITLSVFLISVGYRVGYDRGHDKAAGERDRAVGTSVPSSSFKTCHPTTITLEPEMVSCRAEGLAVRCYGQEPEDPLLFTIQFSTFLDLETHDAT